MGRTENKDNDLLNAAGIPYGKLIRQERKRKSLKQEELGAMVQVGKNAVGAWELGRSRPNLSSIPVLCEALDLSLEEFFGIRKKQATDSAMTEGPFSGKDPRTSELEEKYNALTDYHKSVVMKEIDLLLKMQKERVPEKKRKFIRIYRNELSACAGPSYSIGEENGEEIWIEETPVTARADEIIRISGDSMEPEYHDGDEVLVQHGVSVRPGEIGIFTNGDAGYIKVYQRDGLHSLNPAYPTMKFHEGEEVRCIGKVIGIAGKELFARENEFA